MRREGSPWQGLGTVLLKELADHFDSLRMLGLALLTVLAAAVPFYLAVRLGRHELAWMALGGWLGTLVDPGGLRSGFSSGKTPGSRRRRAWGRQSGPGVKGSGSEKPIVARTMYIARYGPVPDPWPWFSVLVLSSM